MFNLPVSTLRYYDKEGLFPNMERSSGIRKFTESEIEALRVMECLKKTGMEIKDIKQFTDWCEEGPSTYSKRKKLFEDRKKALEEHLQELEKNMAMIKNASTMNRRFPTVMKTVLMQSFRIICLLK